MTTHIGFTGTQAGMTDPQKQAVRGLLGKISDGDTCVHHGDCVGSDDEMHDLAWFHGSRIVLHPADIPDKRAFAHVRRPARSMIVHEPKPPIERDHDIVHVTSVLIATPRLDHEERRSGTWATIRYAWKLERPVYLVWPDGLLDSPND